MNRMVMELAYDGTDFHGWQIQKEVRTIQQEIEKSLAEIAKQPIRITGSGRTDAGVHARQQFAHFDFPAKMTPKQLTKALNARLPGDILVKKIYAVSAEFNARFDAVERTYHYVVSREYSPFDRYHKTYLPRFSLDIGLMKKCIPLFLGRGDFTAFSKDNPDVPNHICEIESFELETTENDFTFQISADRYLHNMVRRIVGTILNISNKGFKPEIINELFKLENHKLITTAPACGLYLMKVRYMQDFRNVNLRTNCNQLDRR